MRSNSGSTHIYAFLQGEVAIVGITFSRALVRIRVHDFKEMRRSFSVRTPLWVNELKEQGMKKGAWNVIDLFVCGYKQMPNEEENP